MQAQVNPSKRLEQLKVLISGKKVFRSKIDGSYMYLNSLKDDGTVVWFGVTSDGRPGMMGKCPEDLFFKQNELVTDNHLIEAITKNSGHEDTFNAIPPVISETDPVVSSLICPEKLREFVNSYRQMSFYEVDGKDVRGFKLTGEQIIKLVSK